MSLTWGQMLTQNSNYDGGSDAGGSLRDAPVSEGKTMKPAPINLTLTAGTTTASYRGLFGGPWPWGGYKRWGGPVVIAQPAIAPTGAALPTSKNPLDQNYGPPGTPIAPTVQPALVARVPAFGW